MNIRLNIILIKKGRQSPKYGKYTEFKFQKYFQIEEVENANRNECYFKV